jgi:hypothetical protein
MSNRLAAYRMIDRVELIEWAPRPSRWDAVVATARSWLRAIAPSAKMFTLSPHLRRDLGLPEAVAVGNTMHDIELRRVRL